MILHHGSNSAAHTTFLRPNSKGHRHRRSQAAGNARLWKIAVLFHLHEVGSRRANPFRS